LTTSRIAKSWITLVLVAGAFLAAHLHFLLLPGIFKTWNAHTTDQLFVLRNNWARFKPVYNPVVAHVDLTNSTIRELQTPYLSRLDFSRVIENLAAMQVSAQLWDFIFAAPDRPEHDTAMIRATRKAGHVYYGMALKLSRQPEVPADTRPLAGVRTWQMNTTGDARKVPVGLAPFATFDALAGAARGVGSLSIRFDPDGVLRRVPLLVRRGDGFIPVLSLQVACDYLGVGPEQMVLVPGQHLLLKDARRPGDAQPADIRIPIDEQGYMRVNFAGPWERMDHYNIADILHAADDREELEMWGEEMRGKLLVISDLSTGSADIGTVPGDAAFPLGGVHANIINNILTGAFLRDISNGAMLGIEVLLMLVVWFLSIRLSSTFFSVCAALLGLGYLGGGTALFLYDGLLLNMVRPVLMLFFAIMGILVYRYIDAEREKMEGLRQRDEIRTTFGRYLSNDVVEELLASPGGLNMGGEVRRVTFLVADLRGFTALSGTLGPALVIEILNRFLGRMVDIVSRYQGTVDEIQGDGLLVFFGAPLARGEEEARAVACAVDMQRALIEFNADSRQRDQPELGMGIGIHTGSVVVGNIGSEKRAKYGAVGSAINTAFRIESYTVAGQILVSETTFAAVQASARVGRTMDVRFKGLAAPLRLYEITGIDDREMPVPTRPTGAEKALEKPLPVICHLVTGKEISPTEMIGELTATGRAGGQIGLPVPVAVHANLLVRLHFEADKVVEIYAKVTAVAASADRSNQTLVRVHYTWMPAGARAALAAMGTAGGPGEDA
jgi:adenylate cyclase